MFTSDVSLLKHNNIIKVALPPQKIFRTTTRFTDFSEHVSSPQTTVIFKIILQCRLLLRVFSGVTVPIIIQYQISLAF